MAPDIPVSQLHGGTEGRRRLGVATTWTLGLTTWIRPLQMDRASIVQIQSFFPSAFEHLSVSYTQQRTGLIETTVFTGCSLPSFLAQLRGRCSGAYLISLTPSVALTLFTSNLIVLAVLWEVQNKMRPIYLQEVASSPAADSFYR